MISLTLAHIHASLSDEEREENSKWQLKANDRNIILINGSPTELNRDAYKHVYLLTKGAQSKTRIARLISDQKL